MNSNSTLGLLTSQCGFYKPQSKSIFKTVIIIVIFFLGVSGNALVVCLVTKAKKLHKQMCYVIANIAVADIVVLSLGLREWLNYLLSGSRSFKIGGTLGSAACKVNTLLQLVAPVVSITSVIVMSIERLRAIRSNVRIKPIKSLWFVCLMASTWLIPIAVYGYSLYAFDIVTVQDDFFCLDIHIDRQGWILYHYIFYAILVFLFVVLVILNIIIIKTLESSMKALSLPQIEMKKREKKFIRAVQMVACFTVVFMLFWSPRSCLKFLDHLLVFPFQNCTTLYFSIDMLFLVNCVLSPLIYFMFLRDFRDSLKWFKGRKVLISNNGGSDGQKTSKSSSL